MEEHGRLYWLKLKANFFKRHDTKIIKAMPNGKDYLLFYLNLLLESLDHNGRLRFSDTIPYNEEMLAVVTDTNVDIVRQAIKVLTGLELVEILDDGTYYMREIEKMVGSETAWAEKKRITRAKAKGAKELVEDTTRTTEGQCPDNVRQSIEYRDKSIERDINNTSDEVLSSKADASETTTKPERIDYERVAALFHELCPSIIPKNKPTISKKRQGHIRALVRSFGMDGVREIFARAEASDYLSGRNGKWLNCSFDWLINQNNALKVLEGNYDNRESYTTPPTPADRRMN